ncbi:MAG TPA: circularly permuted type 2 ATP-grasp protein, partial [Aquabacterium sp.]|nr:circularly permuted type 2 ATP-grasp protein [Aquabacterium sp.]
MSTTLPLFDHLTAARHPQVQEMLHLARPADAGHYDELRDPQGGLRTTWQQFAELLGEPLSHLNRHQEQLQRQIHEDGVTYNVYNAQGGPSRPWSLEALPLILSAAEWQVLERGVAQRARLLNHVLRDVYGSQRVLHDGLLPAALVLGHPGYLRGLQGVEPAGGVYLHVQAFDLVRGANGQWWVAGQRTQSPSGLGYVMQNRLIISRLFPDAYRGMNVQHLATTYRH